ncbi:MAG: cupredoxin domain-containing protein [Acidobacteria bacterium]|nr:cupredoxin domain-containing protein [Acidobacteriota bacterium]
MRKFLAVVLLSLLSVVAVNAKPLVKKSAAKGTPKAAANKVTVTVTSFQFTPKTITVAVGTTVVWFNKEGRHTIEADKGEFKSEVLTDGKSFEFTFSKAGKYAYHCGFHGEAGGKDMAGTVVVK